MIITGKYSYHLNWDNHKTHDTVPPIVIILKIRGIGGSEKSYSGSHNQLAMQEGYKKSKYCFLLVCLTEKASKRRSIWWWVVKFKGMHVEGLMSFSEKEGAQERVQSLIIAGKPID